MVLNGLDHLADAAPWLKGRRLGLITSTSGVTRMLTSGIDAIHAQFPLTALFGPEHGVRGDHDAGATVETYTDPATRLPVYSLYRKDSQHMTPEMLDLVDTVIYDIQDIGARFYTYISTLLYAIREMYPNDFALRQPEDEKALLPINRLTGSDVLAHDWPDFDALMERWENEAKAFDERAAFARMYE